MTPRTYLDDENSLSITDCRRMGWLKEGATFSCCLIRRVTFAEGLLQLLQGKGTNVSYDGEVLHFQHPKPFRSETIEVVWTPCNYSGVRPWFFCPGCGNRAGRIFWSGKGMKCRTCCNLSYRSQSEASYDRALRRARTVYQKTASLEWQMEHNLCEFPPKPKNMHWQTYDRLQQQYAEALQTWWEHARASIRRAG
jgi:hypothetical protein